MGFGPVPWWGVVWKEERLWERNRLHLNMLHFLPLLFCIFLLFSESNSFSTCSCQHISDHKTFVAVYMCVCACTCAYSVHYMHVCLWCECLSIQHRLRSRKSAQLHIPLKNLASELWGDFNPRNRTLAHTHTHRHTHIQNCIHTYAHTHFQTLSLAHMHKAGAYV